VKAIFYVNKDLSMAVKITNIVDNKVGST